MFFFSFLKNWIIKPYFYLPSNCKFKKECFFSVNQLENNDAPGNKESALFCWHVTFDGICHSAKDLWNWIAMSMTFSGKKLFFDFLQL